jgi:hypothetical protein
VGFANMAGYVKIDPQTGDASIDWRDLTREQAAAVVDVQLTPVGHNGGPREIRAFKLGDKRAALMDIAKLFGWIVERRENKIVDEFDSMSNDQIEAWLDERAAARMKVRRRFPARERAPEPAEGGIGGCGDEGKEK